jgi:DNA-binding NarL/FixJ family response regulator
MEAVTFSGTLKQVVGTKRHVVRQQNMINRPNLIKIRILLIEDNVILRDGIKVMLNEQPDLHVAGTIGRGINILKKVLHLKPHVVLLDVGLRDINEISLVESIRNELPEAKVIGMCLFPSQSEIVEFVEAGASGFILKNATIKEFIGTVRSVAHGVKILPPTLTDSLFSHVINIAMEKKTRVIANAVRMTNREREIMVLIADGLSNKQIAQKLHIAIYTAKSHVHNILEKLALNSRLQIALYSQNESGNQ